MLDIANSIKKSKVNVNGSKVANNSNNVVKDDDKKLSEDDIELIQNTFKLFDKNGDGTIDRVEIKTVMRKLGQDVNNDEINDMLKDSNTDFITFEQFLKIVENSLSNNTEDETEKQLMDAFRVFDKDNNGSISRDEFRNVMNSLGEVFTEDDLEMMIIEADTNGDGQIDYAEFVQMITNK
jgi:calmodulin